MLGDFRFHNSDLRETDCDVKARIHYIFVVNTIIYVFTINEKFDYGRISSTFPGLFIVTVGVVFGLKGFVRGAKEVFIS